MLSSVITMKGGREAMMSDTVIQKVFVYPHVKGSYSRQFRLIFKYDSDKQIKDIMVHVSAFGDPDLRKLRKGDDWDGDPKDLSEVLLSDRVFAGSSSEKYKDYVAWFEVLRPIERGWILKVVEEYCDTDKVTDGVFTY